MSNEDWENLEIPTGIAYFYRSTPLERMVACYPGAAGVTESLLTLEGWEPLMRANPIFATLESDVEALLVNRMYGMPEYYRIPIDECYRLSGLIRLHWTGFSGGDEVHKVMDEFFDRLKARGNVVV